MRVLLIEADASVASFVEETLKVKEWPVDVATHGVAGVARATSVNNYGIIILNTQLPDMPGLEALRAIREAKVLTYVLILSHRMDVQQAIRALDLGADDFITRPLLHPDELVARMNALLRRQRGHTQPIVVLDERTIIDLSKRAVFVDGKRLKFTSHEFGVLELLAENKDSVVSKGMLMERLYGEKRFRDKHTFNVWVSRVRRRLREATGKHFIATVPGEGFTLADEYHIASGHDHFAHAATELTH